MKKEKIHIRAGRANSVDCKTLCGQRIHGDIQLPNGRTSIHKRHNVPSSLMYVRFSCTLREASNADNMTEDAWGRVVPNLRPHNPPIRAWDFCDDCWENDIRAVHELKGMEL